MRTVDREDFVRQLAESHETIRKEAFSLTDADYLPWPDFAAYYGEWQVFPLHFRSWPAGLEVDFEANRRRCPKTTAILEDLGAVSCSFSRMRPGCRILRHRDAPDPGVLRAHLGLSCPGGAFLQVADEVHEWRTGEVFAFDGQIEHETFNHSQHDRIVLLVDLFVGPDATASTR